MLYYYYNFFFLSCMFVYIACNEFLIVRPHIICSYFLLPHSLVFTLTYSLTQIPTSARPNLSLFIFACPPYVLHDIHSLNWIPVTYQPTPRAAYQGYPATHYVNCSLCYTLPYLSIFFSSFFLVTHYFFLANK